MTRQEKTAIFMIIFFSLIAIAFALFYVFDVINTLDSFLVAIYMSYFLGLALMYFSSYQKQKGHRTSRTLCLVLSIILILASLAGLIYGFCTGTISLFW